ncbi:MAG: DUF4430 domain-containing protein [Propionibacteriaceae bacterium]|nr:DUF4430 domain-containing protein [Propionibacteriaceae bacterium]
MREPNDTSDRPEDLLTAGEGAGRASVGVRCGRHDAALLAVKRRPPCVAWKTGVERRRSWWVAVVACLVATVAFVSGTSPAQAASEGPVVYLSVEKFTTGQGYILEPVEVPLTEGMTVAEVLEKALADAGLASRHDGSAVLGGDYLLVAIEDPTGSSDPTLIPQYIKDDVYWDMLGEPVTPRADDAWLSTGDYTMFSGWMFTVDDVAPDVYASDVTVADGDVIRVQYSLYGVGADLGLGAAFWGYELVEPANGDSVTRTLALLFAAEDREVLLADSAVVAARDEALRLLIDQETPQAEIDAAEAALLTAIDAARAAELAPEPTVEPTPTPTSEPTLEPTLEPSPTAEPNSTTPITEPTFGPTPAPVHPEPTSTVPTAPATGTATTTPDADAEPSNEVSPAPSASVSAVPSPSSEDTDRDPSPATMEATGSDVTPAVVAADSSHAGVVSLPDTGAGSAAAPLFGSALVLLLVGTWLTASARRHQPTTIR